MLDFILGLGTAVIIGGIIYFKRNTSKQDDIFTIKSDGNTKSEDIKPDINLRPDLTNVKSKPKLEPQTIDMSKITNISLNGSPTIYINPAHLSCDEDDIIELDGNTLYIHKKSTNVTININNTQSIINFKNSYTSNEILHNLINFDKGINITSMIVSGSGTLILEDLKFNPYVEVSVNGSGDINYKHCLFQNARFAVKGSGDIIVDTNSEIDKMHLSVQGSGDIHINGKYNRILSKLIHGSGDIHIKEN